MNVEQLNATIRTHQMFPHNATIRTHQKSPHNATIRTHQTLQN